MNRLVGRFGLYQKSGGASRLAWQRGGGLAKVAFSSTPGTDAPPPNKSSDDGFKFPAWKSLAFTAVCGAGLLYYFYRERERLQANRSVTSIIYHDDGKLEVSGTVGTPRLGGPLQLTDHNGRSFDSHTLDNKFMLVYFGFTHCPDICPEELDRMTKVVNLVEGERTTAKVLPVLVTVDPDRDGPAELREYLRDFHPSFVGLTGSKDEIRAAARKYRVYYRPARTSSSDGPSRDYLVDHSIFFFLIDPAGQYVTHFGRDASPEKCAKIITDALHSWDLAH